MSEPYRVCPLTSKVYNECRKDCAWYNNETGNCAVLDISLSLTRTTSTMLKNDAVHKPTLGFTTSDSHME